MERLVTLNEPNISEDVRDALIFFGVSALKESQYTIKFFRKPFRKSESLL